MYFAGVLKFLNKQVYFDVFGRFVSIMYILSLIWINKCEKGDKYILNIETFD